MTKQNSKKLNSEILASSREKYLKPLFHHLSKRNFNHLEKNLTQLIKKLEKDANNGFPKAKIKKIINTLCHDFNHQYLLWFKSRKNHLLKEIKSLESSNHPNFLFAHLKNGEKLFNLMLKIKKDLKNRPLYQEKRKLKLT